MRAISIAGLAAPGPAVLGPAVLGLALAALLFANTPQAKAQEQAADPIDIALKACLDKPDSQSTAGMVECLTTAYQSWDKALNAVYLALGKTLDPKSRAQLKRAQRQWVAYRDAERRFEKAPWTFDRGTLIQLTLNQQNVDMVRNRVLMLRGYLPMQE